MKISSQSNLSDIKNEFNRKYPFLKIEFYKNNHHAMEGSPKNEQINEDLFVSSLTEVDVDFDMDINPEMLVSEFEADFFDKTGLTIQVFRNSAGIWLQTTATDHWSLEKQNGKGQRSLDAVEE